MSAWFLDKMNGYFYNGMELQEVPVSLHTYYSVHGYLSRILNNTFEIDPVNQLFNGSLNLFSVHTTIPPNVKKINNVLSEYIKKSGAWVSNVKVGSWEVNKKGAYLQCVIFCIRPDRDIFKFKIKFAGRGAVIVETWKGAD